MVAKAHDGFTVSRKDGRYLIRFTGGTESIPVRIVLARPLSDPGRGISFLDEDKKEIAWLDSLACLDDASRAVAEEALAMRYLAARILSVRETKTNSGTRFWDVDTSLGRRTFAMKDPNRNTFRVGDDRMVLKDTLGNRYEIESVSALDKHSQTQIERVV